MSKETTSLDVANWYFLSVTSMYAAARGLFDYNLFADFFNLSGGILSVVYIVMGLSALYNVHSLVTEGP